ncbi:MAG TPA: ATP-binding cassette domain-containing protein [Deltaproteobacteria bacterium]|nr:ATP-binding cassette domain-containing protein [Deltaproteobacteria bacterium]
MGIGLSGSNPGSRSSAPAATGGPTDRRRSVKLSLRGVGVSYKGRWAVRGVDLDVAAGGCTALVGPSGAGKSSLLLAIDRLHDLDPEAAVVGRIQIGPDVVSDLDPQQLRRRVGLLFQRPAPFPLSIVENVAFPLRAHGVRGAAVGARVEESLRAVALWDEVSDRLDARALTLSGGQQQRLCLARALALEPEVLLLDEPCAALDPAATARVEEALVRLRGRVTVLVVTHNLGQARRLADEVACLWPGPDGGTVAELGPTQQVLQQPSHPDVAAWLAGTLG